MFAGVKPQTVVGVAPTVCDVWAALDHDVPDSALSELLGSGEAGRSRANHNAIGVYCQDESVSSAIVNGAASARIKSKHLTRFIAQHAVNDLNAA